MLYVKKFCFILPARNMGSPTTHKGRGTLWQWRWGRRTIAAKIAVGLRVETSFLVGLTVVRVDKKGVCGVEWKS